MIRFNVWHCVAAIAVLAVTYPVWSFALRFALFTAIVLHQDYYMSSCEQTAERAQLAGKPESLVAALFGEPASIRRSADSPGTAIHLYDCGGWQRFEVRCENGVVDSWWVDD
jgi:hypothetical protein